MLLSIFGQIAIIRVEQKMEKTVYTQLSGAFSFEALMVYFRAIIIVTPLMLYLSVKTLLNSDIYNSRLEGVYKQDDVKHTQWINQFGRQY